jgi:nucleoside-diphosphate-sugar epimerase
MRILVTGAEGFVGTHLVRELGATGHRITASDIEDANLAYPGRTEQLIQTQPDYVVHLAARYGRLLCRDEPHRAVSDNTAATTELAAACAAREIPVLYTSSSEIYGDHGEDTITEDSELRMPTTIYGLSKRWGEEALQLYLHPEQLCIVRMNMLYGPEQLGGYGRCSLATFIDNAVRGEAFTVHRETSRSWLYISDAVQALRLLIEKQHRGIFNLGNSHERRPMTWIGERVEDIAGGKMVITDPPPGQIRHKQYDTSKIESLGWRPRIWLEAGLHRTVAWAKEVDARNTQEQIPADHRLARSAS